MDGWSLPEFGAFVGALKVGAIIARVKRRYRRHRRLVPDAQLVRRRAAGEPLRALAQEYGVAHTTLGRYFARPQLKAQLEEQAQAHACFVVRCPPPPHSAAFNPSQPPPHR